MRLRCSTCVTTVPCYQRAAAVTGAASAPDALLEGDAGEEWVAADGPDTGGKPNGSAGMEDDDDIPTLGEDEAAARKVRRHGWNRAPRPLWRRSHIPECHIRKIDSSTPWGCRRLYKAW